MNDKILEDIKKLDVVYHVTSNQTSDGTRLTIAVDRFAENSVSNVIAIVIRDNGNIKQLILEIILWKMFL